MRSRTTISLVLFALLSLGLSAIICQANGPTPKVPNLAKRLAPNDPVKASETASATSISCVRGEKKRAAALLRQSFKSQAQAR